MEKRKLPPFLNNHTPTREQLEYVMKLPVFKKLKSLEEMSEIRQNIKERGKILGWTNGCFDLGHWGHCRYLNCASVFSDYLIVGTNSDESIRRTKGKFRPIGELMLRLESLASLESVDYVMVYENDSPVEELKILQPDLYIKGNDYTIDTINQEERRIIESYGGKVVITPTSVDSTTKIVKKMLDYFTGFFNPQTGKFEIDKL